MSNEWESHVQTAYQCLRKHNSSIPDEVLDGMREVLMRSAPKVDSESILQELSALYWYAYDAGHDDTVRDEFINVHSSSRFDCHVATVKKMLESDSDFDELLVLLSPLD